MKTFNMSQGHTGMQINDKEQISNLVTDSFPGCLPSFKCNWQVK